MHGAHLFSSGINQLLDMCRRGGGNHDGPGRSHKRADFLRCCAQPLLWPLPGPPAFPLPFPLPLPDIIRRAARFRLVPTVDSTLGTNPKRTALLIMPSATAGVGMQRQPGCTMQLQVSRRLAGSCCRSAAHDCSVFCG